MRTKIAGMEIEAFYFRPGDPVAHRYMCRLAIERIFHYDPAIVNMRPLDEPIYVELSGRVVAKARNEAA